MNKNMNKQIQSKLPGKSFQEEIPSERSVSTCLRLQSGEIIQQGFHGQHSLCVFSTLSITLAVFSCWLERLCGLGSKTSVLTSAGCHVIRLPFYTSRAVSPLLLLPLPVALHMLCFSSLATGNWQGPCSDHSYQAPVADTVGCLPKVRSPLLCLPCWQHSLPQQRQKMPSTCILSFSRALNSSL